SSDSSPDIPEPLLPDGRLLRPELLARNPKALGWQFREVPKGHRSNGEARDGVRIQCARHEVLAHLRERAEPVIDHSLEPIEIRLSEGRRFTADPRLHHLTGDELRECSVTSAPAILAQARAEGLCQRGDCGETRACEAGSCLLE